MKYCVCFKTWKNDLCWLIYALQFFWKNWRDQGAELIILANEDCREDIQTWNLQRERVYYLRPWPDTYNFHMYATLLADDFTSAEQIYFFDSDIMLVEPLGPSDLLENDLPIIYTRLVEQLNRDYADAVHQRIWLSIAAEFLGNAPDHSFMQAFPFCYWADTIRNVRRLITRRSAQGVYESLYSGVPFHTENFLTHKFTFCDYEILGGYAYLAERARYCFKPVSAHPPVTKLYHSWTHWSEQTRRELDYLLGK